MTISRGATVRNIMQTDVFRVLKESGHRLVILTPAYKDPDFLNEFKSENIFFENLVEPEWGALDRILVGCHKALVYNDSTKLRDLYGIPGGKGENKGSYAKYILKRIIFWPLSKIQFLKDLAKLLDTLLVKDKYYKEIFDKYNPDLVFSTSVIEDADVYVLKQAQARRIRTIGMPKSWDNLSKLSGRVKTDKLIVWGQFNFDEALKYQNYKAEDIIICGIPQFDFYRRADYEMTREEFCSGYGIDPDKKLIVFCSEGKYTPYDGEVADIIAKFINGGKLKAGASLLVRPHFLFLGDENKFKGLEGTANVFVDKDYKHSESFRDNWDYSAVQIKKFTNMMRHADIVITSISSISLDASAFDKPIINIKFDGYHKLPFKDSLAHIYIYEHYKKVLQSGGVWVAENSDELLRSLNGYLENPGLLGGGRAKLREYFCYKIDGRSGERVGKVVLDFLS